MRIPSSARSQRAGFNPPVSVPDPMMRPGTVSLGVAPNPFAARTTLSYRLADRARVRLAIYDVAGREVRVLVDEEQRPGTHEVTFAPTGLPSGVYRGRLAVGDRVSETRIVHVQ